MNTWKTVFKPGDKAYIIKNQYSKCYCYPKEILVDCIQITKCGIEYYYLEYTSNVDDPDELWDDGMFMEEEIGNTVFVSLEDANKAVDKETKTRNKNLYPNIA